MRKGLAVDEPKKGKEWATSVLFTKNGKMTEKINPAIHSEDGQPQNILLVNEKKVKKEVNWNDVLGYE